MSFPLQPVETALLGRPVRRTMLADLDPVVVGFAVVLLAFVFFAYLLVRRTLVAFREGFEENRR